MSNDKTENVNKQKNQLAQVFKDPHEKDVMLGAYKEAVRLRDQDVLDPESFSDIYSEELIERCNSYTERRDQEFEERRTQDLEWARAEVFGKTLEGIFHDVIKNGAFGDDVRGLATSKYDDYHVGVDEVLERRTEDGSTYIGCALDFTFGQPDKKINEIVSDIKNGKQRDVTFYESPFGDPPHIRGQLNGIPRMVVGIDANNLTKIAEIWLDDPETAKNSQLFLLMLRQIMMQADVFSEVARKNNQPEIREKYEQIRTSITNLYTDIRLEKQIDFLDANVTNDLVFTRIKERVSEMV